MNNGKIKILIVEDEPLIAQDLKRKLIKLDYTVVGVAYDSSKAISMIASKEFDIALLDIDIKGEKNGIDLAKIINEKFGIPFIYITSFSDEATLAQVKATVPSGYIVKPFDEKDLFAGIEIALYKYQEKQKDRLSLDVINGRCKTNFTEKEHEIIMDFIEGLSGPQIAAKRFVSLNTIKSHIKNIYMKLETHTRAETISKILKVS